MHRMDRSRRRQFHFGTGLVEVGMPRMGRRSREDDSCGVEVDWWRSGCPEWVGEWRRSQFRRGTELGDVGMRGLEAAAGG
jgi:hypothetical protein